jgi:hypothetical protein
MSGRYRHDMMFFKCNKMKYVLLIISIILIVYPVYAIVKCLMVIDSLSNYGIGVLTGGLVIFISGLILMYFTIRSIKRNK